MGLGQVPVALVRGLIGEQAVVHAEGDFLQMFREVQVGRRGINRIAAED